MTALTHAEPRSDLDLFHDPLPELFRRFMRMSDWPAPAAMSDGLRVDVSEDDGRYLVKAEVPGARKEDIQVSVDGHYVSIRAEVKEEKKEEGRRDGQRTLLHELRQGSFSRGFTLPQEVDDEKAEAKYENGVLQLTLPKRAPSTSRTLSIK